MRVLLDTNVLISYLLVPRPDSPLSVVIRDALEGRFTLLLTPDLVREFTHKIRTKPYLARRISPTQADRFIAALSAVAEIVPPITGAIPSVVRDPKGDYLLAYALLGRADYLVTGDRDLLVLDRVEQLRIVTPGEFVEIASGGTA